MDEKSIPGTEILAHYFKGLVEDPNRSKEDKIKIKDEIIRKLGDYVKLFSKIHFGAPRARKIHELIEFLLHEPETRKFVSSHSKCEKGCAHCCYLLVTITEDEANLLERIIKRQGIRLDHNLLIRQLDMPREGFIKNSLEDRKCVFLTDRKMCAIYEHRPSACRTYFSVDGPSACYATPEQELRDIRKLFLLNVELVSTAAMNVNKTSSESIAYWFRKKGLI